MFQWIVARKYESSCQELHSKWLVDCGSEHSLPDGLEATSDVVEMIFKDRGVTVSTIPL